MRLMVGKLFAPVALAAGLVAAAGCGSGSGGGAGGGSGSGGKAAADTVTGVVRVGDKTLTHGRIEFHIAGGRVAKSPISIDGKYEIRNAPAGSAKVMVVSGEPPPMPAAAGAAAAKKMVRVDFAEKYTDPAKTDLVYEIKPGQHQYDVVLTP